VDPNHVLGEFIGLKTPANRRLDLLALFGASLLVGGIGVGAFLAADKYHVDATWVFVILLSIGFFAGVGWDYRREFRSPTLVLFFVAWLLLHSLIFVLVVGLLSWLYYVGAVFLELFAFYASAFWLFGLNPPKRRS
jgi:hypothetical protein